MAPHTSQVYFDGYMPPEKTAHHFELVAGALCLDFVNTVGDRTGTRQYVRNYLQTFDDLIAWGLQTEVLAEREAATLRPLAHRRPDDAAAALTRAVDLRETLHTVFSPVAAGRAIPRDALADFNRMLPSMLAYSRLEKTPDASACRWVFDASAKPEDTGTGTGSFDRVAWSVVQSATALLTSRDLEHVHQCSLETCGWLFLDLSKNKTRRWCSMKMCGNKSKVRHHRATRREGREAREP
jgi:predicted RNA-binding Zn ribbon-like protein